MDRASVIFCILALALSLGAAAAAFPFAAMSPGEMAQASQPQAAETMGMVNVGHGFGEVTVLELVDYYIENPPAPPQAGGVAERIQRFGGC